MFSELWLPLQSPGPAAYSAADPYISGLRPPRYSIGARRFHPDKATNTPGPGAYSPEKVSNILFIQNISPELMR